MNKRLVVIGSMNIDMTVSLPRIPAPGETVGNGVFFMNPGGKGANQAVAAARLGAGVSFVGKVGSDAFGAQARELCMAEGIDSSRLSESPGDATGVALISVDAGGNNAIAVAAGANAKLCVSDVQAAEALLVDAGILLMQLEVPLACVEAAAAAATRLGVKIVLNPAPAVPLPESLLKQLYCLTPNETEAELLTGIAVRDADSAQCAAWALYKQGARNVVITLGDKGCAALCDGDFFLVPAVPARAVDSTAAGDIFNGAMAVGLLEGMALRKALEFASQAASISVTRRGALCSAPYRHEIRKD